MAEQLEIPQLFMPKVTFEKGSCDGSAADCLHWLMNTMRCSPDVEPYVTRLFDEFGRVEAYDRAHILPSLCGLEQHGDWSLADAEYVGLYDHEISDHHVIWDRHWAINMHVPRELVPKVWKCGYGGLPKFFSKGGELLFQSVYIVDGKIVAHDERTRYLAEMAGGKQDAL